MTNPEIGIRIRFSDPHGDEDHRATNTNPGIRIRIRHPFQQQDRVIFINTVKRQTQSVS